MDNIKHAFGLLSLIVCFVIVSTLDCREKAYDFNGKRCCSKCPPEQGMAYDCSHGNDTQCSPCVLGITYSPYVWHTEKCRNCSECKKDSHVKVKCSLTKDTVCECNVDFFFSNIEKQCLLCNFCPIGYGAIFPCGGTQNSICSKCPNGTYSDVKSATQPCKVCTKCSEGQAEFKPCTETEDTICYGRPEDMEAFTFEPRKEKKKEFDVIPVYCAILGAVILGLLGYVIFKQYTRLKNRKIHKGHPHDDVEYSKASGGDSGVFVENDFYKQYNQLSRVKDLPTKKKKEIEKTLSISSEDETPSWKQLAKALGYHENKIEQFESSSPEVINQIHSLIVHWAKYKHSTVGVLIKALKNINRHDIVTIIQTDSIDIKNGNRVQHIV